MVSITNFGPGKTKATMLQLRKTSLWRWLFRRQVYAVLMPDYEDPLSGRLPSDLDVGDKLDLTFRPSDDIFIKKDDFTQVGISDPFGRTHWISRGEYERVKKLYFDQPDTEPADASNDSPRVTPAADAPVAPRSDGR